LAAAALAYLNQLSKVHGIHGPVNLPQISQKTMSNANCSSYSSKWVLEKYYLLISPCQTELILHGPFFVFRTLIDVINALSL
jgi:hypothetical protein